MTTRLTARRDVTELDEPAAVALLRAIVAELRALRLDVQSLRRPADARLPALMTSVFDVLSDSPWTAALLFEMALDHVPGRAELRAALLAVTGPKPEHAVRRLGRYLAAAADVECDGLRLVRLAGRGRDGATYRILDVIAETP